MTRILQADLVQRAAWRRCLVGVQLAASLTGTRLVAAAIACSAAFGLYRVWPAAAPDPVRAPAAPTYSYVPLLGDPTGSIADSQAQSAAGCAPFIATLTAFRNWSLQIVDGASGCTGDWIHDTYEVHSDGSVLWTAERMPARVLHLTAPELALITRTNDFPCQRTDSTGYTYNWMRIAPGGDPEGRGAAELPSRSLAGEMLQAVMQGAIERYRTARLAEIGPFELHLTTEIGRRRYRIDMDATGHVALHRGRRELTVRILEPGERAELFDHLATRIAAVRDRKADLVVQGVVVVAGVRLPIALAEWDDPQFGVLWNTLADASELESRR
jgi:hypothetical protein